LLVRRCGAKSDKDPASPIIGPFTLAVDFMSMFDQRMVGLEYRRRTRVRR
jgi:hypothetical protein